MKAEAEVRVLLETRYLTDGGVADTQTDGGVGRGNPPGAWGVLGLQLCDTRRLGRRWIWSQEVRRVRTTVLSTWWVSLTSSSSSLGHWSHSRDPQS